jgi:hypothetical protein
VGHQRCAHCRNPVRGRQAHVDHVRSGMVFHADCWANLHATVQAEYARQVGTGGLDELLGPYQRATSADWLPEAAIDEAVEALTEAFDVQEPVTSPPEAQVG